MISSYSNKENQKLLSLVLGALLFNIVFWSEQMALNTVFFGLYIIVILFCLYPNARYSNKVRWLLAGHLLCLAMVVWHNTTLSKFGYNISLIILVAFAQYQHRSIAFAGASFLENLVYGIPTFLNTVPSSKAVRKTRSRISRYLRMALIPGFLVLVFFVVYNIANTAFNQITVRILEPIGVFLENFFNNFSFGRFFFFLFGLFVTTVLLYRNKHSFFARKDIGMNDQITRIRRNRRYSESEFGFDFLGKLASGMMARKNLNTIAMISLVLLNLLLLAINTIDISYLWFGFDPGSVNLYELIHDGSNMLIISILLAIAVVVVFFKGNLNFYAKSGALKTLAYLWIFQNIVLVISVFIRDYYYIREAGLARNRIGVLAYLALVLFGLLSVCWKIYHKKSTYFLFRVNGWAAFALLVISTTINWDVVIVKYNLSRKDEIIMPAGYMTNLSPSVLPLLDANRETLVEHEALAKKAGFWGVGDCDGCALRNLDNRIGQYEYQHKQYSWLSWSQSDQITRNYFESRK